MGIKARIIMIKRRLAIKPPTAYRAQRRGLDTPMIFGSFSNFEFSY